MYERAQVIEKKGDTKKGSLAPKAQNTEFSTSISSAADRILSLQRTIGNQAVQRLFQGVRGRRPAVGGQIQPKLTIGQPNDIYEQDADPDADQVSQKEIPKEKDEGKIDIEALSSLQEAKGSLYSNNSIYGKSKSSSNNTIMHTEGKGLQLLTSQPGTIYREVNDDVIDSLSRTDLPGGVGDTGAAERLLVRLNDEDFTDTMDAVRDMGQLEYLLEYSRSVRTRYCQLTEPQTQQAPGQSSDMACVAQMDFPKNHSGVQGNLQGIVSDSFEMEVDWEQSPCCRSTCGEYHQEVRGHVIRNGRRVRKRLYDNHYLEESTFHEDADEHGRPYGHRTGYPNESIDQYIDPAAPSGAPTDRETAPSYRGIDMPNLPAPSGSQVDWHLWFKGYTYDRCNNTRGREVIWESVWNGIVQ